MNQQVDITAKVSLQVPTNFHESTIRSGFRIAMDDIFLDEPMEKVDMEILNVSDEAEIYGNEGQHFLAKINVRIGDDEHTEHHLFHDMPTNDPLGMYGDKVVTDVFGNGFCDQDQSGFYYDAGCKLIHTSEVTPITKFEYTILNKYL